MFSLPPNTTADTDTSCGKSSNAINATPRPVCPLCRREGEQIYTGLTDWLYEVPGSWGIRSCPTGEVFWLDPQPLPNDLPKLYARYSTHKPAPSTTWIGRLQLAMWECALERFGYPAARRHGIFPRFLSRLPSSERAAILSVLALPAPGVGSLLDVGCGNGEFISRMKAFGWKVSGLDPDPQAVSYGRNNGLDICTGTIADLPGSACYDVITLTHVIEHVADPVSLLQECGKRLRSHTGRLIITTPNIKSLGHARFRKYWRGLEAPRHFMIFSPAGLRECVTQAGMSLQTLTTETRLAQMIYLQSASARAGERNVGEALNFEKRRKFAARLFRMLENSTMLLNKDVGEEIFCVCTTTKATGSNTENG